VIQWTALSAEGQITHGTDLETARAARQQEGTFVWLDMENPTEDELVTAGEIFGLTSLTVEDMGPNFERAKFESFPSYKFVILHAMLFNEESSEATTPEVDFALGRHFLISAHHCTLPEVFDTKKWESDVAEVMRRGCDFLLYTLTDRLVDSYFGELEKLDDAIDRLEDSTIANPTDKVLSSIFDMKRAVVDLRKVTFPELEVLTRLTTRNDGIVKDEYIIFFRDVHDHLYQVYEVIDSYRDLMSGVLDAYLSTVSNRLNDVMKRLTVISTIFLPITALSSVFGMNVGFMPQVSWDPGFFWWIIIGFLAAVSIWQIRFFRRKGWI
jgi:magnesium transporter